MIGMLIAQKQPLKKMDGLVLGKAILKQSYVFMPTSNQNHLAIMPILILEMTG